MSLNPIRPILTRNRWIAYAVVEVALFVVANLTAKSSGHPGTASNAFFITFIAGLVLALLLGAATLLRRRRTARRGDI
jgi:MYXO-CTERM domain-containing protein